MNLALQDVVESARSLPMALHFAWGDTKARYRRSTLGPFWIVLGTAIGVTGLGVLWSELLHTDRATLVPSLTIGLVLWQLISGCVIESPSVFVRYSTIIRNIKTPFILFPMQMILRQLINFAHNALVILVVLLIYPPPINLAQMLIIPGLLLVVGNLLWIAVLVGMLGARFRDLEQLIGAMMPMLFFISPVIYRPNHLAIATHIIWGNPFTYLITVIRDPLEGLVPDSFIYVVAAAMLICGWTAALWLLHRRHNRLAFWV